VATSGPQLVDHVQAGDTDRDRHENDHGAGLIPIHVLQQAGQGQHDEQEEHRLHQVGHEADPD